MHMSGHQCSREETGGSGAVLHSPPPLFLRQAEDQEDAYWPSEGGWTSNWEMREGNKRASRQMA